MVSSDATTDHSLTANHLRSLLNIILIFCNPGEAIQIWEEFKNCPSDDIYYQRRFKYDNSIIDENCTGAHFRNQTCCSRY